MKAGQWLEGIVLGLALLVLSKALEEATSGEGEREPWRWREALLAGSALALALAGTAVLVAFPPSI